MELDHSEGTAGRGLVIDLSLNPQKSESGDVKDILFDHSLISLSVGKAEASLWRTAATVAAERFDCFHNACEVRAVCLASIILKIFYGMIEKTDF
jgi:hypothetical protein